MQVDAEDEDSISEGTKADLVEITDGTLDDKAGDQSPVSFVPNGMMAWPGSGLVPDCF